MKKILALCCLSVSFVSGAMIRNPESITTQTQTLEDVMKNMFQKEIYLGLVFDLENKILKRKIVNMKNEKAWTVDIVSELKVIIKEEQLEEPEALDLLVIGTKEIKFDFEKGTFSLTAKEQSILDQIGKQPAKYPEHPYYFYFKDFQQDRNECVKKLLNLVQNMTFEHFSTKIPIGIVMFLQAKRGAQAEKELFEKIKNIYIEEIKKYDENLKKNHELYASLLSQNL